MLEADVVVVGYGGAGATAALAAHDMGASVIILEKTPTGGGNTCVSGGSFIAPTAAEDIPAAISYINALNFGTTESEIIETMVVEGFTTADWLTSLGGKVVPFLPFTKRQESYPRPPEGPNFPNIPGGECLRRFAVVGDDTLVAGRRIWDLLAASVSKRNIQVLTNTRATQLVQAADGRVTGVAANHEGNPLQVTARRGVVLTTGGFEFNDAMKDSFLSCRPFYASGNPCNTGDGIIMAQKAGAALWHMNAAAGYFGFKTPEFEAAFMIRYGGPAFIHVNRNGMRFCNETGRDYHDMWRDFSAVDSDEHTSMICHPNIPAYGIFDEETRQRGSLYKTPTGMNGTLYKWSDDNSVEIDKGWIKRADTIGELAHQAGIDPAGLEHTVHRYNESCRAGEDPDFGRRGASLRPIERAPYYAIELWPSMLNTQGGPRRDKEARVLDHDGRPIPGLFAAGELGTVWGFVYGGGGNITDCLAFGRIAGRNVARFPLHH